MGPGGAQASWDAKSSAEAAGWALPAGVEDREWLSLQFHVAAHPTAEETLGVSQQKWNSNREPEFTWYILIDCHDTDHLFIIWVSFLYTRSAFVQGGTHAPLNFYMEKKNLFYLFIALLSSFQQAFGKSLDPDL